ncbi:MAG TPA: aldehyde dehydrogenase family protein [Gemmatimonadales bacterium]|nr:aldehyde dehydrogenase family protein [Gemmatimonadales bacterium]
MPTRKTRTTRAPQRKSNRKPAGSGAFRLTYATMFDPPELLHRSFERALADVKSRLGRTWPMLIGGEERLASETFADTSPINYSWVLGNFQKGTSRDARDAIAAARAAFPAWSAMPWRKRVALLRRVARIIEQRVYEFAAIDSLEVGKNRMEALADVQETADLINYYCDQMERSDGFAKPLRSDPLKGYRARNLSVLRPYGVWVVISPFNFPVALAGGPAGAALVAGNTVVFKPASDTPWTGYFLAKCFLDAGLPRGVFNFITGPGSTVGNELMSSPDVDGITFTGSYDVGMRIIRTFASGASPRPCIAEMGGKNPVIVSRRADLDRAALGVYRSAYGLQGQKCSAASRIYVERPVKDAFVARLLALLEQTRIGDPTLRDNWLGPVINEGAARDYEGFVSELRSSGTILFGGRRLDEGDLANGAFCAPTLAEAPLDHRLWKHEMFLPIAMVHAVDSLDEAMRLANDVNYGLTAGFYGSAKEAQWFFDHIQAGVCYANRPQGATTGAWPGFQPFGGWKGSGSTGKSAGGLYYVQQYMREQSRTLVS